MPSPRRWLPSYLSLALIWGFSFLFIKVALESFSPGEVAFGRILLGAVVLGASLLLLRIAPPPRWALWRLLVGSLLFVATPWTLFALAETHVSSSLAGIINGATPLMTLLATLLVFREERPRPGRIVGLILGFLGVVIVVGWTTESGSPLAIAMLILAVSCYGVGYPYVRRYLVGPGVPSTMSPVSMSFGLLAWGVILTLPLAVLTPRPDTPPTGAAIACLAALGILGSGVAYILNLRVVTLTDATTASTVTYVIPLVAVIAGAVILREPLSWNEAVGGVIVLVGAGIAQGLLRPWGSRRRAKAARH
ncbi:MAG: DMT family transporter [Candidatus Nanopelagicales bacterium]